MKLSEKIEVRLSHEEKTALTEIAEKEERSVSHLVRDVMNKYIELNTARVIPARLSKPQLGAMLSLAAILGFGVSSAWNVADQSEIYNFSGQINGSSFDTPLHRKAKKTQLVNLKTKDGNYQIEAVFSKGTKLTHVAFSVCEKTQTKCQVIASESLAIHPDKRTTINSETASTAWFFRVDGPNYKKKMRRES